MGRAILILLAIGLLLFVVVAGALVLISTRRPPRPVPTTQESADERADRRRRVVLENRKLDDQARAMIFGGALRAGGQRCDSVESAIMQDAGVWRVSCAPGYRYLFTFDARGDLASALRLP